MSNIVTLGTENDLNKVIKAQRKSGEKVSILFHSLWDKTSIKLLGDLSKYTKDRPLYLVDSFSMPHAFIIFRTTKVPHLVNLGRYSPVSMDYLPIVYKSLGILV